MTIFMKLHVPCRRDIECLIGPDDCRRGEQQRRDQPRRFGQQELEQRNWPADWQHYVQVRRSAVEHREHGRTDLLTREKSASPMIGATAETIA